MVAESLEFEGSGLGRNLMDTSAAPESGAPTKRRRMSRRLVAVIAVIVILIAAVGAGAYIVLTAPAARNVLVVGTTEREETLDPADAYNYMSVNFTNRVEDPANTTQQQVDQTWANYSTGQAQGVEVVDATTVKIHMGRPWSPMVLLLAFTSLAPVNPTVFKTDAFKPLASSISASEPYRIDTFVSGERAELVRNPRYFGAPAAM